MITLEDVTDASRRIAGVAHRTPVLTSRTLGDTVFLKAECFQRTGSFKFRGAYNKLSTLPAGQDVLAYSSGNHAQAVALAARLRGVHATIVMPEDAPAAKLEATRGYGAEVITYDRFGESREEIGLRLAEERGLALVKPYDDPEIMAGQGTLMLELLEDVGELDTLLVPVSGGGLIAGSSTVLKTRFPDARVIGIEPASGDDHARSHAAGERVRVDVPRTIADGLGAPEPGELTWQVNRELVDEFVAVSDAEIVEAMRFLFDRLKIVVEPSGAVGVAALLQGRVPRDGRIGIVLSGGNVGAARFAELLREQA
ncbi:MAG: pyridoxal-phosphate dependent enzyme [Actinomycetota bacterium]